MAEAISLFEHCVRELRRHRCEGWTSAELLTKAREMQRNTGLDANKMLELSLESGPVE